MKHYYFCRHEALFEAFHKGSSLKVFSTLEDFEVVFHGFITSVILTAHNPKTYLVSFSKENNKYEIVAL